MPERNALILDDQWLHTLLEIGAVGFLAWAWLFFGLVRRLGRASKTDPSDHGWLMAALAASITAFAAGMLTYDAFSFVQVTFVAFVLCALSAVALRQFEASSDWVPARSTGPRPRPGNSPDVEPSRPKGPVSFPSPPAPAPAARGPAAAPAGRPSGTPAVARADVASPVGP